MTATKEQLLDEIGKFTWDFGQRFFVETRFGNFVWSDPDYNGDNTFKKYQGDYKQWIKTTGSPFGRSKGSHLIRNYCGDQIIVC